MSTSPELERIPPSPIELVEHFESSHEALVDAGNISASQPTAASLGALMSRADQLSECLKPLVGESFFKDSENHTAINMGLGIVINSADQLADETMQIAGKNGGSFDPDLRQRALNGIYTGDYSEFMDWGFGIEDASPDLAAALISNYIGKFHTVTMEEYLEAVTNSGAVRDFRLLQEHRRWREMQAKHENRRQAMIIGGAVAAAVAGQVVINRISRP